MKWAAKKIKLFENVGQTFNMVIVPTLYKGKSLFVVLKFHTNITTMTFSNTSLPGTQHIYRQMPTLD